MSPLNLLWMALVLVLLPHAADADDIPVESVLDHAYGKLDAASGCRNFDYEGITYCMKVDRIDRLDTDTGPRVYVLLTGNDSKGGHPSPGLVGAWIMDRQNDGQIRVIASNPALPLGANGAAPSGWKLIRLAKSDYWAWHTTTGDMHQGYSGSFHAILGPYGHTVRQLGFFVGSYSDSGACNDEACERQSTDLDSTLAVNDHDSNVKVYPLAVTVTGRMNGRTLAPKVWTVPFDVKTWKYVPPKNWPLADRDF